MTAHFILFVADQKRARDFYRPVLQREPRLDEPGMTEFDLGGDAILGLMPEESISSLLGPSLPNPGSARGAPRAELYLHVTDPQEYLRRLVASGGTLIDEVRLRDWGDNAGYGLDLDGHLLAFAERPVD
jgi:predicted enzyme related to lactoylglutathione lyase